MLTPAVHGRCFGGVFPSFNRIVCANRLFGGLGSVRLGRSLRSLPRLTAPQFASPGLAPQALIRAGKPSFTTGNVTRKFFYLTFTRLSAPS